jgi:putative endonuclease
LQSRQACVYILSSGRNGTLYVGVTSNLIARIFQHRENQVEGFTKAHHVHDLVWFEVHETIVSAIAREKTIKNWRREWKVRLIEETNPYWRDLYSDICG